MAMHPRSSISASCVSAVLLIVLGTACRVEGSVKGSASANESRPEQSEPPPAAPPAPPPPAVPVAAAAPPADACPLSCFEARGSERVDVTAAEQAQLRSALEPVLGRMRGCTSPEDWRRHGSPVINLRLAPDGTLADLGVDPHHGRDSECLDESGRSANVSVSLPGRKVVRCAERCVHESPRRPRQRAR